MIEIILEKKVIQQNRDRKISLILDDTPLVTYTYEMALEELVNEFISDLDKSIYKHIPKKYFR